MSIKKEALAELRYNFALHWAPDHDDYIRRSDFEVELDRLIYAIFAVAQEPFLKELEMFKDQVLKSSSLSIKPPQINP